jgi:hypothetical protein
MMPLGYVLAPRTFSIRLLAYLEDLMVVATSAELAITHTTQTDSSHTSEVRSVFGKRACLGPVIGLSTWGYT